MARPIDPTARTSVLDPPTLAERSGWAVRGALVALAAALATVPAGAQDASTPCYDVELGPWDAPLPEAGDSLGVTLPSRVRLSEATASRGVGHVLEVAPGALGTPHPWRTWWPDSVGISLRLGDGFTSVSGQLGLEDDGYVGAVRTFWDFAPGETQTRPVRLEPIACDAPHDPTVIAQRAIPASIRLADGREIVLGAPIAGVPGTEGAERGRSRYVRDVTVEGLGRVREIRLEPNSEGLVRGLSLRLPEGWTPENVAARWNRVAGAPTGVQSVERGGVFGVYIFWQNRSVTHMLVAGRRLDEPWDLTLALMDPRVAR